MFAVAFATVALTFGLIPWLAANSPDTTLGDPPPPSIASTPTTGASTATTRQDGPCPSADVPAPAAIEDLPDPVAATRDAIISAALACDIAALEDIAGDELTSSFGGGGSENLSEWNDQGLEPTTTLVHLLAMNYATVELEDSPDIYVWPAALTYQSWGEISDEELEELRRIHTDEELALFEQSGTYAGWRIGIDADGTWLYFIAGD